MNEKFVISISAEDKKGLLGLVTAFFNRKNFPIESLNVSRTDIRDTVLITLEVLAPPMEIGNLLRKLEKIIEVYKAVAHPAYANPLPKVGFFHVANSLLLHPSWTLVQKHGVTIRNIFADSILLEKIGTDEDILSLYNQLDSIHLLHFCKTALISDRSFIQLDGI